MLQSEFEQRVGYSVKPERYAEIEQMYVRCDELDKDTFCKEYQKPGYTLISSGLVAYCEKLEEQLRTASYINEKHASAMEEQQWKFVEYLMDEMHNNDHEEHREKCIEMVGEREYIKAKIARGEMLSETDSRAIYELLQ